MYAIVAVAVFCASAFAIAVVSDDSSAASEESVTYSFYLDLRDGSNSYSARLADVSVYGTEPTSDLYTAALTNACEKAGLTIVTGSYGMISSITADGVTYAGSAYSEWGGDNYQNFAVYYYDGAAWKDSSLADETMLVIVFDKYAFSEPSDASKYYKNEYPGSDPYWSPLPTVKMVEYKVYFQMNDGDKSFSKWTSSIQPGISGESLKSARTMGAEKAGFSLMNGKYATGLVSVTANDYTYSTHGTYGTADYYGFATYCQDGTQNKWKDMQSDDLTTATVISHVFDNYKMEDPQDDSFYYHAPAYGMDAYWTKLPAVMPSGDSGDDDDEEENNIILYAGIAAAVILVIVVVAFFMIKKKP
ncbi:MAG: hypothetical protein E7Z64_05195 [Thermoplasmata archaeon]|nr:hypothetical protein [Thermoplasmata archaeon]